MISSLAVQVGNLRYGRQGCLRYAKDAPPGVDHRFDEARSVRVWWWRHMHSALASVQPPKRALILFDDRCPLCVFQMRLLTWVDWFDVAIFHPLSKSAEIRERFGLSEEAVFAAIHCLTPDGAVHRGARCIRYLSLRMPLLVLLGILLWIPGVIWVAEHVYAWVASNRLVLSRVFGCRGACQILPARARPEQAAPTLASEPGPGHPTRP